VRIYFLNASEVHLPSSRRFESETPCKAACVAAPIRKECEVYFCGSSLTCRTQALNALAKLSLVTGQPSLRWNRYPGFLPRSWRYLARLTTGQCGLSGCGWIWMVDWAEGLLCLYVLNCTKKEVRPLLESRLPLRSAKVRVCWEELVTVTSLMRAKE